MNVTEIYEKPRPPIVGYTVQFSAIEVEKLFAELRAIEAENLPYIQRLYWVLLQRRVD